MFCLLYFSLGTDHVLALSVLLYYLNHPIVFFILVTGSTVIYKEKISGTSISSRTEALMRKQLGSGCTFLYFPQTISGGGCKMKMLHWLVLVNGRWKKLSFQVQIRPLPLWFEGEDYFPLPCTFRTSTHPPSSGSISEPSIWTKSYICPLVKHLLFANLFFPQTPAPFCVCANVPNVYTA